MKNKIYIPEPCSADWGKMTPCKDGRFCGNCQKVVVDFSNKTLDEMNEYFSKFANERICGRFNERHTTVTSRWYNVLNFIESSLVRIKLQKPALFIISGLLILSGCKTTRRTVMGSRETRFLLMERKDNARYVSVPKKKKDSI